jgi:hypothetical protein
MSISTGMDMSFAIVSQKIYDPREPREKVPQVSWFGTGSEKVTMTETQLSWYGKCENWVYSYFKLLLANTRKRGPKALQK